MVIVFDLDGTLLNTISDLGRACNHALAQCGYPIHATEEYPQLVGNGINRLIERALPAEERNEKNVLRVRQVFVPFYDEHNCELTFPYEGIREVLNTLKQRGCRLAVASNKYQTATEKIIAHYFPDTFDIVSGEHEGIPRKPNPQIVENILASLGESRAHVIYIGDSLVDVATAHNASLSMIACSWGFCPYAELKKAEPAAIAQQPAELLPLIDSLYN